MRCCASEKAPCLVLFPLPPPACGIFPRRFSLTLIPTGGMGGSTQGERGEWKIFAKKFVGDEKFPYLCNVLELGAGVSRTGR